MSAHRWVAAGVTGSVLAIAVGVGAIDAAWSTSVAPDVDLAVVTPAIPEPQSRSCVTEPSGISLNKRAHFTWSAPAGGIAPTAFVIRVQNGATTQIIFGPTTATSADITVSVLQGLGSALSWLVTLLLGGPTASAPVTINAVYGDYESPNNWTHQLTGIALPSAGIGCSTFSGGSGLAAPSGDESSLSVTTTTTIVSFTTTSTVPVTAPTTTAAVTTTTTPPTTTTIAATTTSTSTTPTTSTTTPTTSTTTPTITAPTTTTVV